MAGLGFGVQLWAGPLGRLLLLPSLPRVVWKWGKGGGSRAWCW